MRGWPMKAIARRGRLFHDLEDRPLTVLAIAFAAGLIGGRFLLR